MKSFRKLSIASVIIILLLTALLNILLAGDISGMGSGIYRVEAKRIADSINESGSYDPADYPHITGVYSEDDGPLYTSESPYVIIEARGRLYRVEYKNNTAKSVLVKVNLAMSAVLILTIAALLYLRMNIVKPFGRLNKVPQELAKGNLAVPMPEEKSRFFGKFIWGVNLMRESIEDSRRKEISMQREKKLLLLSLSHDIKTPLSAIKLNAKALAKGLYKDEEKRIEAAENINKRADEIESFVSQITKASSEDFMNFEAVQGEEFLSRIVSRVSARYTQQLEIAGTELKIQEYTDCILSCDPDRLSECLQNLIENAIKYGDGRLIELSFDTMDGCELITVSNTGCTLDVRELPQIFDSFQRGSNVGNANGNGLGLFICRKLMTLMGGEVFADIRDDCFLVTLVVKLA